jgi:hypothetical protein
MLGVVLARESGVVKSRVCVGVVICVVVGHVRSMGDSSGQAVLFISQHPAVVRMQVATRIPSLTSSHSNGTAVSVMFVPECRQNGIKLNSLRSGSKYVSDHVHKG